MNITMTRTQLIQWALGIIAVTAAVVTLAFYVGFKAAPKTVTMAPPASSSSIAAPIVVAAPVDDDSGAELVPGAGTSPSFDEAYRCKAGFSPVQVPVGQTKQLDGATFTLTDNNPKRELYTDQESVTVTIKLPTGVSAPTMIVNTAAHNAEPDLYPQHKLQIALGAGGTGTYTLSTGGYAKNYEDVGITDVTVCTKPGK